MIRTGSKYLHHLLAAPSDRWYPLLAVYYLTYACKFRCPYCSDGKGTPYHQLKSPAVSGAQSLEILSRIRKYSEYVVITGGEPLQHPDAAYVLDRLGALKFDGVIFTTSGHEADRFLDAMARSVDYLVFSLDTMDHEKADGWLGARPGTFSAILDNMEQAASIRGRKYRICVSSVVTPYNIPDLYAVYAFAASRGFEFAACPQLNGVKAHPALASHPAYKRFYDFLIAEKKQGARITGSVPYLRHMRDLDAFSCRPFTMLTVAPDGEVFYPCLELGRPAGNILDAKSLHALRQEGFRRYGPPPKCSNQCHSACSLSFSVLLNQPFSVFGELFHRARGLGRKAPDFHENQEGH